jgi:hypothetical protein
LRRLRDIFYINGFPENNEVVYYGMEFKEFYKYSPVKVNNILQIKSEYWGSGYSSKCNMTTVREEDMNELLCENIYSYGDFCWVDYDEDKNLELLQPQEIAELLYLGHMFSPVNSPFFESIKNRYAYLAHDDGWFCRLYCQRYSDFSEIIAHKVIDSVSSSRRKIYPMNEELKHQLLSLASDGLLIDFDNILKDRKSIQIPIYQIGKFIDMDKMYNDKKVHIVRAKYSAMLVYSNKNWKIEYIITRGQ